MATSATAQKSTAAERISSVLSERILQGEFAAGAPLREEDLATEYHVSRHVIREALRALVAHGMAEYSSFRGVRVPRLTKADVEDIYRVRRLIECGAVLSSVIEPDIQRIAKTHGQFSEAVYDGDWRAAYNLDIEFHSSLVAMSGSQRLISWHRELMHGLSLAHLVAPSFAGKSLDESVPQHAEIIVGLTASDASRAAAALEKHLSCAECVILQQLSGQPE